MAGMCQVIWSLGSTVLIKHSRQASSFETVLILGVWAANTLGWDGGGRGLGTGFGSLEVVRVDSVVTGMRRRVAWAGCPLGWT